MDNGSIPVQCQTQLQKYWNFWLKEFYFTTGPSHPLQAIDLTCFCGHWRKAWPLYPRRTQIQVWTWWWVSSWCALTRLRVRPDSACHPSSSCSSPWGSRGRWGNQWPVWTWWGCPGARLKEEVSFVPSFKSIIILDTRYSIIHDLREWVELQQKFNWMKRRR